MGHPKGTREERYRQEIAEAIAEGDGPRNPRYRANVNAIVPRLALIWQTQRLAKLERFLGGDYDSLLTPEGNVDRLSGDVKLPEKG